MRKPFECIMPHRGLLLIEVYARDEQRYPLWGFLLNYIYSKQRGKSLHLEMDMFLAFVYAEYDINNIPHDGMMMVIENP